MKRIKYKTKRFSNDAFYLRPDLFRRLRHKNRYEDYNKEYN